MNTINKYDPSKIELKWQKRWEESGLYRAVDFSGKPKKYLLIEFPYPSGERLHVGHGRSYCCLDMMARYYRMKGFNVLFPIGWDAFGLPAENYAIKTGINPQITTRENIANAKVQAQSWGLSFDWSREINTTDPDYYRWSQWIFLKLLEHGLAYRDEVSVNWCPKCKTNLADEEVLADGTHERCGKPTEKRMQKQWLLRITKYADRLLEDLKTVDYLPRIAQQQINWIGRKEGTEIEFSNVTVFTTRPETILGATFVVIAPEMAQKLLENVPEAYKDKVTKYIETSLSKSELERQAEGKVKTGVDTGIKVINPFTKKEILVYVADYVLMSYGTGAVMGVPGHDARDYEFAQKYKLPIISVVQPRKLSRDVPCEAKSGFWDYLEIKTKFGDKSEMVNSGFLDGLTSFEAKIKIEEEIEKRKIGKKVVNYHLRDWVFSRQHYWGEPIPVVYCEKCGVVPVFEKDLPVKLPYVEKYEPTGTGESPLADVKDWVETKCPKCGGPAKRETDTMPNWAGSNWYYVGYLIAKQLHAIPGIQGAKSRESIGSDIFSQNKDLLKYWLPVDLYNGGMEHTTLHLLYSRFIYKFLYDIGAVPTAEPYAGRRSHGVVLGPDGAKMSKSKGNVINPDEVVKTYGADTFRLYEAFMGPFDQMISWSDEGVEGCQRFLKRVFGLATTKVTDSGKTSDRLLKKLNQTIKKVGSDLETMKFNTAVASMMEFVNEWAKDKDGLTKQDLRQFLLILAPFAPHLSEELWQIAGPAARSSRPTCSPDVRRGALARRDALRSRHPLTADTGVYWSIHQQSWPKVESELLIDENTIIIVEVNGKMRDKLEARSWKLEAREEIEKLAKESEKVKKYLTGKKIKKVIFVSGKLINFVTE